MSNATHGYGAVFAREDDTTAGTYNTVGEVTEITLPSASKDTVQVTHHASADRTHEFIGGLVDPGEVTITVNYDENDAEQELLVGDVYAAGSHSYKITLANGVTFTFDGICTNYSPASAIGDRITRAFTFKITGKPVIA